MTKKNDVMQEAIKRAVAEALRANGIGTPKSKDDIKPINRALTEKDWEGCRKPCSFCGLQKDIVKDFGFTLRRSHLTPQSRCIKCRAHINYRGLKRVYDVDGGEAGKF